MTDRQKDISIAFLVGLVVIVMGPDGLAVRHYIAAAVFSALLAYVVLQQLRRLRR